MEAPRSLCPSAPLYQGSRLLGIANEAGEVDILAQPLELNEGFVEAAQAGSPVGQRFRFVNKCVKSACQQWDGASQSCSVIKTVLEKIESTFWKEELVACGIRSSCRWYSQEGANACKVCPLVKYQY